MSCLPFILWTLASIHKQCTLLLTQHGFSSWRNAVIRLHDVLKPLMRQQKYEGNLYPHLLLKKKYCLNMFYLFTHSLSTVLGNPQLCLLMLHLWTVAKAASLQENQTDYKKLRGILSYLHHVITVYQQQTASPMASMAKSKCVHSFIHTVVSDTSHDSWLMKHWPLAPGLVASSPPSETTVVCILWHRSAPMSYGHVGEE